MTTTAGLDGGTVVVVPAEVLDVEVDGGGVVAIDSDVVVAMEVTVDVLGVAVVDGMFAAVVTPGSAPEHPPENRATRRMKPNEAAGRLIKR